MAETGKTTGGGHPIHSNTTIPSKPHSSSSAGGEEHVDMQSFDEKGKASPSEGGQHLTDEGSVSWGHQAHDKGSDEGDSSDSGERSSDEGGSSGDSEGSSDDSDGSSDDGDDGGNDSSSDDGGSDGASDGGDGGDSDGE